MSNSRGDGGGIERVWIVVPLYRPDGDAVFNLNLMAEQAAVVAIDDGSPPEFGPILEDIGRLPRVTLLRSSINQGIAAALNRGIRMAANEGVSMIVTFDQDSTPGQGHVAKLIEAARGFGDTLTGVVGPGFVGGEPLSPAVLGRSSATAVTTLYQSGMAVPMRTVAEVGYFDESLFIDGVDTDYCLRVRAAGGEVRALPDLNLVHRLGAGHENFRHVHIGPFTPVATFHSAERRYYINRNMMRLLRRHSLREPRWALLTVRRTVGANLLAWTIENNRRQKFVSSIRGILHGIMNRGGPAQQTS